MPAGASRPAGRAARYLSLQASRPHGIVGSALGRLWTLETAKVNNIALELLVPAPGDLVLDIGSGPGKTLQRLAERGVMAVGTDVSPTMVSAARQRNATRIADGDVAVVQGDGVRLKFDDASFDGVISTHSIYFWPQPADTAREILRVLRPGGRTVIAFLPADGPVPRRLDRTVYRIPRRDEAIALFTAAGFDDVHVNRRDDIAAVWLTGTAPYAPC